MEGGEEEEYTGLLMSVFDPKQVNMFIRSLGERDSSTSKLWEREIGGPPNFGRERYSSASKLWEREIAQPPNKYDTFHNNTTIGGDCFIGREWAIIYNIFCNMFHIICNMSHVTCHM